MNHPSDEQLVWLYIKRKDERALGDLIKRYLPLIYAFARNYTGNQDNATDITQETFVKVWKNIKKLAPSLPAVSLPALSSSALSSLPKGLSRVPNPSKGFDPQKGSFKTWIFTIAKRTALDWLKKKNALPFSAIQDEAGNDNFANSLADESRTKPRGLAARLCFVRDESPSITERLMLQETSKKLSFALMQLPGTYSAIINLRINNDLNFREIAERLNKPLNTVKSRYRRGIGLLKKIVSLEGLGNRTS